MNEGIAKNFVDGGYSAWDSETAKRAYEQWTKADGLNWNAQGDTNPKTEARVPGSYFFSAWSEDKDRLRGVYGDGSKAIQQAVREYNEALTDDFGGDQGVGAPRSPGQIEARVSWGARRGEKIQVILTISPAQ